VRARRYLAVGAKLLKFKSLASLLVSVGVYVPVIFITSRSGPLNRPFVHLGARFFGACSPFCLFGESLCVCVCVYVCVCVRVCARAACDIVVPELVSVIAVVVVVVVVVFVVVAFRKKKNNTNSYSMLLGVPYAVGVVGMVVVHEAGHALVMLQRGIPVDAFVFIPFVGAAVSMQERPADACVRAPPPPRARACARAVVGVCFVCLACLCGFFFYSMQHRGRTGSAHAHTHTQTHTFTHTHARTHRTQKHAAATTTQPSRLACDDAGTRTPWCRSAGP
jgi:hypothetical protein